MLQFSRKLTVPVALAAALSLSGVSAVSAAAADQIITRTTFRDIAKKVSPAVVNIKIKSNIVFGRGGQGRVTIPPNFPLDEDMRKLLEQLFERESPYWTPSEREEYRYSRAASGVIIDPQGYVITSNHVIDKSRAEDIEISLPDGRTFEKVKIVGTDDLTDLAVLKIEEATTASLPYVEWGDSDSLEPGDHVVAIGNPLEFNNSVSEGIVSAKHRTINKAAIEDLIQTTAMINPGNSGGALVDLDGKLVGINMAIATSTGLWSGLGFAIPSKTAQKVASQIISNGRVDRGYLGIQMRELNGALASRLGYPNEYGIVVEDVKPDSAAEKAGLQRYDIIAKVNGREVKSTTDMHRQIGARNAGETVDLEVYTDTGDGKLEQKVLKVTLGQRPGWEEMQDLLGTKGPTTPGKAPNRTDTSLGLKVSPNPDGKGVVVDSVERGSRAAMAGVRAGDILYEVNKKPVSTQQDVQQALRDQSSDSHLLYYERGGVTGLLTIPAR